MLIVTSSRPEVSDFLRLDASVDCMRRASKGRSRNLQNRKRRSILRKWLSYSRDNRNQGRKRKSTGRAGKQRREERGGVHIAK